LEEFATYDLKGSKVKKTECNKEQNRENPVAQSHGSNAELSQDRQTADKSKAAKRR
jgi:hypothetical protein